MNKKYELLNQREDGLYQIKALRSFSDVKAGDLGGFIESERNLSHENDCWIYDSAKVFNNAKVFGNARVYGDAWVYGDAHVFGNAWVYGNAEVLGKAKVFGNAEVLGKAMIYGDAIATTKVITTNVHKHTITISDNYMAIGCENRPIEYWNQNIDNIADSHNYTAHELSDLKCLLTELFKLKG